MLYVHVLIKDYPERSFMTSSALYQVANVNLLYKSSDRKVPKESLWGWIFCLSSSNGTQSAVAIHYKWLCQL